MPDNRQQYRGAVGSFNNRFNYNNIYNGVFGRKPNVSSISSVYFAILINFCTFLAVVSLCLIVIFRENIKAINLLAKKLSN